MDIGAIHPVADRTGERADTALARFILELRSKGMMDSAVLNAFEAIPRGVFLPDIRPGLLYEPIALPLPCGEEATDPFSLVRHLVLLDLKPGMRSLEIGTGSGYFTAVLARFGAHVTSVERYRSLLKRAEKALMDTQAPDIRLIHADGLARTEPKELYDRIMVNGAMDMVPAHLFSHLVPGGSALGHRLRDGMARLTLWRKDIGGLISETDFGPTRASVLRSGLPQKL